MPSYYLGHYFKQVQNLHFEDPHVWQIQILAIVFPWLEHTPKENVPLNSTCNSEELELIERTHSINLTPRIDTPLNTTRNL